MTTHAAQPKEVIINGNHITLIWDRWYSWAELTDKQRRRGVQKPKASGVYEVAHRDECRDPCLERLYIGCTTNEEASLWARVKHLLRGKYHPGGEKIHAALGQTEQVDNLYVRWAEVTPTIITIKEGGELIASAPLVEKCLFMRYLKIHCAGPRYCTQIDVDYDLDYEFPDDQTNPLCLPCNKSNT